MPREKELAENCSPNVPLIKSSKNQTKVKGDPGQEEEKTEKTSGQQTERKKANFKLTKRENDVNAAEAIGLYPELFIFYSQEFSCTDPSTWSVGGLLISPQWFSIRSTNSPPKRAVADTTRDCLLAVNWFGSCTFYGNKQEYPKKKKRKNSSCCTALVVTFSAHHGSFLTARLHVFHCVCWSRCYSMSQQT